MKNWFYPDDPAFFGDACRWISAENILLDVLHEFLKSQHDIRMIPYLREGIPGYALLGRDIISSVSTTRDLSNTSN
jgi:hypothetical protein